MQKLVIAFILFFPFMLQAQRFNGGVLLGLTASQVDGDSYAGFDKVGLQGGVFVNTFFSRYAGIQMEIKYTGRGARKKTTEEDPAVYKLTLHYIDIPVMMLFKIKEKFILEAGFVTGYLFAAGGEDSGGKIDKDYLVDFNKVDLDWMLSIRYKVTDNLSAGFRYAYSLFSITDIPHDNPSYGVIANLFGYNTGDYNNYLSFGVYYQFNR